MKDLTSQEYLEIVENLLSMTARKELEIAELKAQLDVFKPKNVDLQILDETSTFQGRIMLVFQSRTLRDILKSMLEKIEYFKVDIVEQYDNALSTFALTKPDICVFEHGSYGDALNCFDIMRGIREMSKDVGLISVLPENDVEIIREVVTSGIDDFLVKPIDVHRMNKVILDIMNKRKSRKAG